MSNATFFIKIVTETNKKFILTIDCSTTMNMLIKLVKKYYGFYFKKKYFIEHILTEDKFVIFENHLVNNFFKNGDLCIIKGKETEDIEQDLFIENKVKYDVFIRKRNKEQINDRENKKIKQNEEGSHNKNTRNYNIKAGINPKLVLKKNTMSEKITSSSITENAFANNLLKNSDKFDIDEKQINNCESDKINKKQNNNISAATKFFNKFNLDYKVETGEDNLNKKTNIKNKEVKNNNLIIHEDKIETKSNSSFLLENIKNRVETEELFATESINKNFKNTKHEITNLKKIKKTNKINYDDL